MTVNIIIIKLYVNIDNQTHQRKLPVTYYYSDSISLIYNKLTPI